MCVDAGGEAFRHVEDEPRADFWDMQRHTLQRLVAKLEDQDGESSSRRRGKRHLDTRDMRGLVVRVHRPPSEDNLEYGI